MGNIRRDRFLRFVIDKSFRRLQDIGIHITKNHFYSPVPDTSELKEDIWLKQSELPGLKINEKRMADMLSVFSKTFKKEYEMFSVDKTNVPYRYYMNNGSFGSVDAEIYYCMIRYFRPNKIIEIGAGNSTYLAAQALLRNKEEYGIEGDLIAIEPYPDEVLKRGFPGLTELKITKLQDIDLSMFKKLKENDILFIDSSHILKIESDVKYEYLEILPRLNKGTLVHIHDIFLPAEYPKKWIMKNYRFWNEQYLLQAFLAFNEAFDVLWGGNIMNISYSEKLEAAFKSYKKGKSRPGSFWIQKLTNAP